MTHNEERQSWYREAAIGQTIGVLYGVTSVCVGHPFDTVKTKMQAQPGFAEKGGMWSTFATVLRKEGIRGLYRGCVPPLWGSGIYRSTQFALFEGGYTYLDTPWAKEQIPLTGGLQIRVVLAGILGSTGRAIIECPLEFAKIRRQTLQSWKLRDVYTGFYVTWLRTVILMTTYFVNVDTMRRHIPELFQSPIIGPFLVSGVAATTAWWLVWPLENMKSQVQGSYGHQMTVGQRLKFTYAKMGGVRGVYRGIGPGTIRSFLANGCSMVVMQWAQRKVTEHGLRS